MTFDELVARHVGLSLRKQLALMDFVGEHSWQLDLEQGVVDFGKAGFLKPKRVYPVQVLGTESGGSGTWLWAWANAQSGLPPALLRAASKVKGYGETQGIAELVTPQLSTAQYPGHLLALVGSGLCAADCYYRGPYEGGAVYFLVTETPLRKAPPTAVPRVCTVLVEVVKQLEIRDHRAMALAYLKGEGFSVADASGALRATSQDGRALTVSFDAQGRISQVQAASGRA